MDWIWSTSKKKQILINKKLLSKFSWPKTYDKLLLKFLLIMWKIYQLCKVQKKKKELKTDKWFSSL